MAKRKKTLTAVDFGTSRLRVVIGTIDDFGENIAVAGFAEANVEREMCKGEITDVNRLRDALNETIKKAEKAADREVDPQYLFIGLSGGHISAVAGVGSVHIDTGDGKVTRQHVEDAVRSARGMPLPPDCLILNSIDGDFVLDQNRAVTDPVNQTASKLQASSHIIRANRNRVKNFQNILVELGFQFSRPVFNGLASALAALRADDFSHGTLVVDMGAGVTDYILFNNYMALKSGVLAVGCDHVANDLSLGLDVDFTVARKLLRSNAAAARRMEGYSTIEIVGRLDSRQVPVESVEKIVELRLRETFEIIHRELSADNLGNRLDNGVILCGGGAFLPGVRDIVSSIFETPVRIGSTAGVNGPESLLSDPSALSALGLLRYAEAELHPRGGGGSDGFIRLVDSKLWPTWKKLLRSLKDGINF